jgi:hypothetical protein
MKKGLSTVLIVLLVLNICFAGLFVWNNMKKNEVIRDSMLQYIENQYQIFYWMDRAVKHKDNEDDFITSLGAVGTLIHFSSLISGNGTYIGQHYTIPNDLYHFHGVNSIQISQITNRVKKNEEITSQELQSLIDYRDKLESLTNKLKDSGELQGKSPRQISRLLAEISKETLK